MQRSQAFMIAILFFAVVGTTGCAGGSKAGGAGGATGMGGATGVGGSTGGATSMGGATGAGGAGSCTADQTQGCNCGAGAIGASYCRPSGNGFGACQCVSYGAVLYVSPTGSATADGSVANPLSLDGARQAVRARVQAGLPAGGIAVLLL